MRAASARARSDSSSSRPSSWIDPDRPDRLAPRADRDRRARLQIAVVGQTVLDDPSQASACRRSSRRAPTGRDGRAHASRASPAPAGRGSSLCAQRRSAGLRASSTRERGGSGSSIVTAPPTTPAIAFDSAKRSPSGTPAIPPAAAGSAREATRVQQEAVQLRPRHLLRHREERNAERDRRARELRDLIGPLEHHGRGTRLRGILHQRVALSRSRPHADREHDRAARRSPSAPSGRRSRDRRQGRRAPADSRRSGSRRGPRLSSRPSSLG